MAHWYVIQVMNGQENVLVNYVNQLVSPAAYDEVFVPRWETQAKVKGEWRYVQRNLMPGYLIAVTKEPEELQAQLRQVPAMAKLLKQGEAIAPLARDEVAWIQKFTQKGKRVVPMSQAVKVGDSIIVTAGPLREVKSKIARIDRHRSTAYIELTLLGRTKEVPVGLRVVAKAEQ